MKVKRCEPLLVVRRSTASNEKPNLYHVLAGPVRPLVSKRQHGCGVQPLQISRDTAGQALGHGRVGTFCKEFARPP